MMPRNRTHQRHKLLQVVGSVGKQRCSQQQVDRGLVQLVLQVELKSSKGIVARLMALHGLSQLPSRRCTQRWFLSA